MAVATMALFASLPRPVWAHGADAGTADIRLAGDTAYVVVWPLSEVFSAFDDNADGRIQRSETAAHRAAMLAAFRDAFALENEDGSRGELVFEDLSTPVVPLPGSDWGAGYLRVTLRVRWPKRPTALTLLCRWGASHPLLVRSACVAPSPRLPEQKLLAPPRVSSCDREHVRLALLDAPCPDPVPEQGGRKP